MTRDEAANLLNVAVNAQQHEIQAKYQDLFNEYQIRLTNAPTPNLKKIYQTNIQELNTALTVLSGKSAAAVSDLPSAAPVYRQTEVHTPPPAQPPPAAHAASHTQQVSAPPATKKKEKEQGVSAGKIIPIIAVAVIAIAIAVFFGMSNVQNNEKITTLQATADSMDLMTAELTRYQTNCDNQLLKIKNDGDDFYVTGVSITYWNEFKKLEKLEFAYYDKLLIRKGSSTQLQKVDGSRITWDGSVVSYAVGIQFRGADFFVSGIFSKDMKDEDKTLHLNFDNF